MPPTPNPDIAFHPFADGGVLHRTGSHRLWVLNVSAATLWCLMDGQADTENLARSYGRRFVIDDATAQQDVTTLLTQFRRWGLLDGGAPHEDLDDASEQPFAPIQAATRLAEAISGLPRVVFTLAGRCFTVTFTDTAMAANWQMLFSHLATGQKPNDVSTELAVLAQNAKEGKRFFCYEDGLCSEGGLARNQVVPFLITKVFEHCIAGLSHRLLFHAAVVARNDQAVLLPAQSGSGKSTLAAALTASGWTCLSDELAVVDPKTRCVESFALPIGLKDKSMAALAAFIPDVADLPRHTRADGIGVRYHRPGAIQPKGCLPIRALVFPRYSAGASSPLTALKPLESLEGLAATGSSSRPLVSRDITAMLKLAFLPSYRLEFSDVKTAVDSLNGLDFS